jgi:hypothetical protein
MSKSDRTVHLSKAHGFGAGIRRSSSWPRVRYQAWRKTAIRLRPDSVDSDKCLVHRNLVRSHYQMREIEAMSTTQKPLSSQESEISTSVGYNFQNASACQATNLQEAALVLVSITVIRKDVAYTHSWCMVRTT